MSYFTNNVKVAWPEGASRTINGRRMQHLTALDLEKLARFGLHAGVK